MKMETIYGYAKSHIPKFKEHPPVMIVTPCSKEKYEEKWRINWQTAYKHEVPVRFDHCL